MKEEWSVEQAIDACVTYWRTTGVPADMADEMRREIEPHLREAVSAGRRPSDVVGPDIDAFAESWAAVYRDEAGIDTPAKVGSDPRRESAGGSTGPTATDRRNALLAGAALTVLMILSVTVGPKEDNVDDVEVWRWIWLGAALVLGIGEMVTAGFFLLPFAIGAVMAAFLAFFNVAFGIQIAVFIIASLVSLLGLRRFAVRDIAPGESVGSLSYRNASAIVLDEINASADTGTVRVESEVWRASTDTGLVIPAGNIVSVVEVRGTRLIVVPRSSP